MKEGEPINAPASLGCFGVRHGQILLHFSFYVIIFGIEISLSSTLPAMLETNEKLDQVSVSTLSQMFSSYFTGFMVTELFGGFVCKKFGFRWPMMIFMGVISVVTLNLPTIANDYGSQGIIFCRVVQGLCAGLLFAMPAEAISRWCPIRERTTLGTTVYASGFLGHAVAAFMGGYLSGTHLGWSFIYTQSGYLAIIWVVLMALYGADSPEQYPKDISESELEYIVQNRGNVALSKTVKIPWRPILTSMPFWAIVVAQIGAGWMLYVSIAHIPMYLSMNYDMNVSPNLFAFISFITWLLSFFISGMAQLSINQERTTIGQSRKICNTLGTCIPAVIFLFLCVTLRGNEFVGIALWIIISVTSVGTICGSRLNSNDITTNFAPIVYGTATWISLVFNQISITVLSAQGVDDWYIVFIYTAILAVLTNAFYLKFGSGEEQDWNNLYEELGDEEMDLSKSTSKTSIDEKKYLLFVRKQ